MSKVTHAAVADVERLYGYDGAPCVPLMGGSFLYPSAAGIASLAPNAPADKVRYWPVGDGVHQITSIAMNKAQTLLVAAERRLKVSLYVYSYPNRKLLQQVPDAGKVEIADMSFSRDGRFLAVLSGPPACDLTLYTVDSQTNRLTPYLTRSAQFDQTSDNFGHHLRHISFSPTHPEVLCGSGGGHCVFWTVDVSAGTISPLEGSVARPNTRITCHQWMPDGSLICGTTSAGLVHFTDLTSPVGVPIGPAANPSGAACDAIADITLSKSHLITTSPDGLISFYSTNGHVTTAHTSLPYTAQKTFATNVAKASYVRLVPENNALVVGGACGKMVYVALPGYVGDLQDDEFDLVVPKPALLQVGFGGPLVGIAHGKGTSVAVISKVSLCTILDYQQNTILSQISIGLEPIAVGGIGHTSTVAITSATGSLRVVSFADPQNPRIIFKGRFSDHSLHMVASDPTGAYLAVADSQYIFCFAMGEDGATVTFAGCVRLNNVMGVNALCFLPDSKGLVVSHASGETVLMQIPTETSFANADSAIRTIDQSAIFINSWRLDTPVNNLIVAAAYDDYLNILTQSIDKAGRLYLLDRTLNPERKDRESRVVKPQMMNGDHEKKGTRLRIAFGKFIVSSASDGKLCLRDAANYIKPWTPQPLTKERTEPLSIAQCHASLRGGVASFCIGFDGSRRIITAGLDGYVAVWNTPVAAIGAPPLQNNAFRPAAVLMPTAAAPAGPAMDADDELFYTDKARKEAALVDSIRYQSFREGIQKQIESLRTKLEEIRVENDASAEDEKVDVEDFLVERHRKAFDAAVDVAVNDMKADVELSNLRRDYVADLIKRECWDVMEVKLTPLVALNTPNLVVHNFHQRTADVMDAALIRKLKFLRIVEETDRRHRNVRELENVYDGVKVDPFAKYSEAAAVMGGSPTSAQPSDGAAAVPEEELHKDFVEELTAKSILDQASEDPGPYLYNPLLVFTRSRSTIQNALLQGRVHSLKKGFNKEFNALVERKHADLHKIKESNDRCRMVLKELQEHRELFDPTMSPLEEPSNVFKVNDADVAADKTTDPDEKKRLAQLEMERLRWIERNGTDGSSDKALKVWMDGRLDKDIRTLEINIPLPDFADETNVDKFVPLEERSDDQVRIFKEYEAALAKRIDEVNTLREQLRNEFQTLQKKNLDIAKAFDDAIIDLFQKRLVISQHCSQVELSQIKLVQAVLMQDERLRIARSKDHRRKGLSDHLQRATKACEKATKAYNRISAEVNDRREEERAKDKGIKTFAPFTDPEYGERLVKHYNRKMKARRKAAAEAAANGGEAASMPAKPVIINPTQDPFAFIEISATLAAQQHQQLHSGPTSPNSLGGHIGIASASSYGSDQFLSGFHNGVANERPSGDVANVPEPLWQTYLAFRTERLLAEQEINRLAAEQSEAEHALQQAQAQREAIADAVVAAVSDFETFLRDSTEEQYDTDDVYNMQQGQVEVDQAPVVMNFDDAVMVRTSVADRLNNLIRQSNEEKLAAMAERMMRLRDIALTEWEVDFYVFAMRSLELQLKHLHTLRVTKQMQEFINGGGDDHNERERQKLAIKIDHVRATMSEKIEDRRQQMQKLRRTIKDKEVENYILQDQVGESKALVDDRRSIRDLQSSELDQMRSDKLMRDMRVTRKLEDVAKAQQAEMGTMKKDIDRLRERTFPSFAVVSKRVVGNPDQM